jgi:hypothetical protein
MLKEGRAKMKKKFKIFLPVVAIVVGAIILLIPGTIGSQDDSMYVTRMYGDTMEGPWSNTSSETTKYVLEITSFDGQTTVVIQEVYFLWESPENTLVFKGMKGEKGEKGEKGDTGPQGPQGVCPVGANGLF